MYLPIRVYLALNERKKEMRSDPSIYMLLIVGFYQRSVPLLLYGFQFICYLKDTPIGDMVYWCSGEGGGRFMDYINYWMEEIFMSHSDDDTEVESDGLWETGMGMT